ncbi:MAG TPA: cytochrome c biogenesis protein CcdA [Verrucomicrobiae bacterium]|nr:cytochrome c biogenesis protein CcdA [Verrucomicrobiae bacterium]
MVLTLALPAFLAGILMFLAPCTLPLVPGYLVFISGASWKDVGKKDNAAVRAKIFLNGLLYVLGFTSVFLLFTLAFDFGGWALGPYKPWLARLGGVIVVFFGLHLMGLLPKRWFGWMDAEARPAFANFLTPGHPWSSFLFGATFAFAWSPCIGPILGSVLLLASTRDSIGTGVLLLLIFCLGYAVPFLLSALAIGQASRVIHLNSRYLGAITRISGAFVVFLGVLLACGQLSFWSAIAFKVFSFLHYDRLLDRY